MSEKPVTVAVATYADVDGAEQDFDAVWGIKPTVSWIIWRSRSCPRTTRGS